MLRVIADHRLPLDASNIRTVGSYIDLWNPLLNPFVNQNDYPLTEAQWINVLKSLWTRQNLTENFDLFFQTERGILSLDDRKKIVEHLPDDLLYTFHFIKLYSPDRHHRIKFQVCKPGHTHRDGSYAGIDYDYGLASRSNYSYRTVNWATELEAHMREVDTSVNAVIRDYGHLRHASYSIPPVHNNFWIYYYRNYLLNGYGVRTSDGDRWLTHLQVAEQLRLNPEAELVNLRSSSGEYEPFIILKAPVTKTNKSALFTVFNYSTSPLTMLKYPIVQKGEHKPVLYGVELEMSSNYSAQQLVEASDEPFFILKQDSSVSGNKRNRYELVTVPMSFKAHKKQFAYWFSNLDYAEFDTTKDTTNGMHVHIGMDSFVSEKHKKDFTWFFTQPAHQDFMFAFSERTQSSMEHYAPMPRHRDGVSRVQTYNNNVTRVREKRGTINYSNKSTIEVRLFRGIVSLADVIKNLEFVDSIFNFTMDEKHVTQLSLTKYFEWLQKQPRNKYHVLRKYFDSSSKLTSLVSASVILDLIFTEKEPQKILDIIKKHKFKATNEHVTILNKRWKKRIFVLDKATGELKLNDTNKSSVSFLDRLLEARILGKLAPGKVLTVTPVPIPPPPQPVRYDDFVTVDTTGDYLRSPHNFWADEIDRLFNNAPTSTATANQDTSF